MTRAGAALCCVCCRTAPCWSRASTASSANQPGGIIEKEMPLALAKVALWNPGAKKADRVGIKKLADGKKVRFFKSTGEVIDA